MKNAPESIKQEIFLVEDEKDVAEFILYFLKKERYTVSHFSSGENFFEALSMETPDLILLDLMLPGISGVEVCRYLKQDPRLRNIPLIMLTAKDDPIDVVLGLEVGADDYITKPFHPRELLARIKAVTRRSSRGFAMTESLLKVGPFILNGESLTITVDKEVMFFSWREFKLLELLAKNNGHVVSRDTILNRIWGEDEYIIDRTVDVYIANIRKKMGQYGRNIITVRGVGYKFEF